MAQKNETHTTSIEDILDEIQLQIKSRFVKNIANGTFESEFIKGPYSLQDSGNYFHVYEEFQKQFENDLALTNGFLTLIEEQLGLTLSEFKDQENINAQIERYNREINHVAYFVSNMAAFQSQLPQSVMESNKTNVINKTNAVLETPLRLENLSELINMLGGIDETYLYLASTQKCVGTGKSGGYYKA